MVGKAWVDVSKGLGTVFMPNVPKVAQSSSRYDLRFDMQARHDSAA